MAQGSANCFRVMLIVQGLDISCSLEQVLSLWLPFIFQELCYVQVSSNCIGFCCQL